MNEVPVLQTVRCTLTAVTPADIPVLREILDDVDTRRFLPELCQEFQTAESLQQLVNTFDHYLHQNEGFLWGIKKDDTLIGFIGIMDIPDNPTLFYATHPAYRNYGYMKEDIAVVMHYVAEEKACCRLETEVYHNNVISQKILKDLGFQQSKKNECKDYFCYEKK